MARTVGAPAQDGTPPRGRVPLRLTALHREHLARKATLAERDGWLLPRSYGHLRAEQTALQQAVGLLDISESGKLDLKSTTLDALLAAAFPGMDALPIGRHGTAGEDGALRVCRLTAEEALLLTTPTTLEATLARLNDLAAQQSCTHLTDLSSALCGLRLLGPRAHGVLERLCALDLAPETPKREGFVDGALAQTGVARVHATILRRDAGGQTGYDLYVDRDLGVYLWQALLEAGAPLGIIPVGRDAEGKEMS